MILWEARIGAEYDGKGLEDCPCTLQNESTLLARSRLLGSVRALVLTVILYFWH
jgi:hypothetical protein